MEGSVRKGRNDGKTPFVSSVRKVRTSGPGEPLLARMTEKSEKDAFMTVL